MQVSIASFATYIAVSNDHILTPQKAFVSLNLFSMMRSSIWFLPYSIFNTVLVSVHICMLLSLLLLWKPSCGYNLCFISNLVQWSNYCCHCQASVSLKRLEEFFLLDVLREDSVTKDDVMGLLCSFFCSLFIGSMSGWSWIFFSVASSLRIQDGEFSWFPDSQPILRNINIDIPFGSLTAVVGEVGAGKSSLLAACVGDLYKRSGEVVTKVFYDAS